jgi:hypothetical protein
MALVQGYSSDEDEGITNRSVPAQSTGKAGTSKSIQAAPEVSLEVFHECRQLILGSDAVETNANKTI